MSNILQNISSHLQLDKFKLNLTYGFKTSYLYKLEARLQIAHIIFGLASIICIGIGYRHHGVLYWGVYDLIQLYMSFVCLTFILSFLLFSAYLIVQEVENNPNVELAALIYYVNAGILLLIGFLCGMTRFGLENTKFKRRKEIRIQQGYLVENQTSLYNEEGMILSGITTLINCGLYFTSVYFQWRKLRLDQKSSTPT